MSKRYLGGVITANSVTPTGSFQDSAAPGMWTSAQQMQLKAAGLWPLFGNASPSAFIENLFSTYLYTGTAAALTITNGIDLAGKGGLVWYKSRSIAGQHYLGDTARGPDFSINSNTTGGNAYSTTRFTSFNTTGFSLGSTGTSNGATYASWTFRKQPKFFDVVTFTTDASGNAVVPHSLGSVPGCVIIKNTQDANNWMVYHRSLTSTNFYLTLNTTDAQGDVGTTWINPTSTNVSFVNNIQYASRTYVAYLFAHDAGGFGLSGNENVVSCGSFTTDANGIGSATLGYEPQFLIVKRSNNTGDWNMFDSMRGMPNGSDQRVLLANTLDAEFGSYRINLSATGFTTDQFNANSTFIYIAIRRGPMAVPTLGTRVFDAEVISESTAPPYPNVINAGFVVDAAFEKFLSADWNNRIAARLTDSKQMNTNNTSAEFTNTNKWDSNTTATMAAAYGSAGSTVMYAFARAPSYMDIVCYTAASPQVVMTIPHNLGAVPELMILKGRSVAVQWSVYSAAIGPTGLLRLNTTGAADTAPGRAAYWNGTAPTSSAFTVGLDGDVNDPTQTFMAYLFATCPGVSKVGSYTGTGTTQAINCGFTSSARFVMIKRTDSTGGWYVWDSARGIVSGNDQYLLLNDTAPQVTNTDYVDTATAGFEISSTAPAEINANGGSYIFLAIS